MPSEEEGGGEDAVPSAAATSADSSNPSSSSSAPVSASASVAAAPAPVAAEPTTPSPATLAPPSTFEERMAATHSTQLRRSSNDGGGAAGGTITGRRSSAGHGREGDMAGTSGSDIQQRRNSYAGVAARSSGTMSGSESELGELTDDVTDSGDGDNGRRSEKDGKYIRPNPSVVDARDAAPVDVSEGEAAVLGAPSGVNAAAAVGAEVVVDGSGVNSGDAPVGGGGGEGEGEEGEEGGRMPRRNSASSFASINFLREIEEDAGDDYADDRSVGHLKRWGDAEERAVVEALEREEREEMEREEREREEKARRAAEIVERKLAERAEKERDLEKGEAETEEGKEGEGKKKKGPLGWMKRTKKKATTSSSKQKGTKVMPAGAPRSEAQDKNKKKAAGAASLHSAVSVSDLPPTKGALTGGGLTSASFGSGGAASKDKSADAARAAAKKARIVRWTALVFLLTVAVVTTYLNATELPLRDYYYRTGVFGVVATGDNAEEMDELTGSGDGKAGANNVADNPDGGIDYTGDKAWVPEGTDMKLDAHSFPIVLENTLLDVYGPGSKTPKGAKSVTPVFLHVPQGGLVAERVMVGCWDLTSAYTAGGMVGADGSGKNELEVLVQQRTGNKYVNVNMMSVPGIQRAASLGLAESDLAEVIITPHLHVLADSTVLASDRPGRLSAILRHPVERAVATYHLLTSNPQSAVYDAEVAALTLEQYADSPRMDRDWLTRFLSEAGFNNPHPVTADHARVAKEVLRKKTLVGLYDRTEETFERMKLYYGWTERAGTDHGVRCAREALVFEEATRAQLPKVVEGDAAWNAIARANSFDMEVYEYALKLWEEQDGLHYVEGKKP